MKKLMKTKDVYRLRFLVLNVETKPNLEGNVFYNKYKYGHTVRFNVLDFNACGL